MIRKLWIAVLIVALCLHIGVAMIVVYFELSSPYPFRNAAVWLILFIFVAFTVADCLALHRRIIDDDGEALRLGL